MIDFTKPVTTADGRPVKILTTEARHDAPVWGYIEDWPMSKWHLDGKLYDGGKVPECHLINPTPKMRVPLTAKDVPPGSVLRHSDCTGDWLAATAVSGDIVWVSGIAHKLSELQRWEIKRPGEDWRPCYHER